MTTDPEAPLHEAADDIVQTLLALDDLCHFTIIDDEAGVVETVAEALRPYLHDYAGAYLPGVIRRAAESLSPEQYTHVTRDVPETMLGWLRCSVGPCRLVPTPSEVAMQAIAQRDRLRDALVGLVGSAEPDELRKMEAAIRVAPAPEEDKAATINAIHALLATAPKEPT